MSEPTLVVVNPASAGGRTGRDWPRLRRILRDTGVDAAEHLTRAAGDATAAVRAALQDGCARIVVVGGDGTLNEVVNGFFDAAGQPMRPAPVIGLLPSATGGDFRRTLGVPRQAEAAAWVIAAGGSRPVDAGRVDFADGSRRHFVNIADCGVGGAVVAAVNASGRKSSGPLGTGVFLWHSLRAIAGYSPVRCTVAVDGEAHALRAHSVVVANGQYFGAGMHVAPEALLDDGAFDVITVAAERTLDAVRAMPSLYRGRHLTRPGVTCRRAADVEISAEAPMLFDIDGEQVGQTPARLTCLRHALRFCVEKNASRPVAPGA